MHLEKLQNCLPVEFLPEGDVTSETKFADLGMDSLDFIQFIADVEDAMKIEIPNSAAKHMKTIGDVERYLAKVMC